MLKLHENLKGDEGSTENMVNNSVQKRKVALRTPRASVMYSCSANCLYNNFMIWIHPSQEINWLT